MATKMHADIVNAKSATETVKGVPTTDAKAKPARSAVVRVQRSERDAERPTERTHGAQHQVTVRSP